MQIRYPRFTPNVRTIGLLLGFLAFWPLLATAQQPRPGDGTGTGVAAEGTAGTPNLRHSAVVDFAPLLGIGNGTSGGGLMASFGIGNTFRLRAGGTFRNQTLNSDGDINTQQSTTPASRIESESENRSSFWQAFLGVQLYKPLAPKLTYYLGLDLGYSIGRNRVTETRTEYDTPSVDQRNVRESETLGSSSGFSIMPHTGVELRLAHRLVLGLEYRPFYYLGRSANEITQTYSTYFNNSPSPSSVETYTQKNSGPHNNFTLMPGANTLRLMVGLAF